MKKPMTYKNKLLKNLAIIFGFSFCLFTLNSCTMMLLKISGNIKNPKLEDSKTIKKYCKKMKDPFDILWMADSKENFDRILVKYPGAPEVLIYDKNFEVLQNAHGEECQKMLMNFFIDSTVYNYKKVYDSSYTFIKEKISVVEQYEVKKDYDYVIVYSWFKWTPKLNKRLFKKLTAIKKTNDNICLISLNKDWQKGQYTEAPHIGNKVTNKGSASAPKK